VYGAGHYAFDHPRAMMWPARLAGHIIVTGTVSLTTTRLAHACQRRAED